MRDEAAILPWLRYKICPPGGSKCQGIPGRRKNEYNEKYYLYILFISSVFWVIQKLKHLLAIDECPKYYVRNMLFFARLVEKLRELLGSLET